MTREQFVEGYMSRSNMTPYAIDGERVTYQAHTWWALECRCGEDGCDGWAMIHNGGQNWHKFQNGLTDMTFEQAMIADNEARDDSMRCGGREIATAIIKPQNLT